MNFNWVGMDTNFLELPILKAVYDGNFLSRMLQKMFHRNLYCDD